MNRTFHQFIFTNEALLAKAALELKFWGGWDSTWWLGEAPNSLVTRSPDVIDVITETFGYVDQDGNNSNYRYRRIVKERAARS